MNWQSLKNESARKFLAENGNADTTALALKPPKLPGIDTALLLDQIKARKKAATKMPEWLNNPEIIFPNSSLVEQASSTATARYKASLVEGRSFADLTAGMGIDTAAMAKRFEKSWAVEINADNAALLENNLRAQNIPNVEIIQSGAESAIKSLPRCDVIYIDPQRRDTARKGKILLSDTEPDILGFLLEISKKCALLMLKTSPMLDITQAARELKSVCAVHIVEWRGECKEVLYLLDFKERPVETIPITIALLSDNGLPQKTHEFTFLQEQETPCACAMPGSYLFEPSPAMQKSGAFNTLANRYNLKKIHRNTHLYTGSAPCPDFPGRQFAIISTYKPRTGEIPLESAEISVRNYPSDPQTLRKKLKIKPGGPDTLFACTLMDESKTLIHVRKLEKSVQF